MITILSIVDSKGIIKNISILQDYETPVYKNKVLVAGLLEKIRGGNVQSSVQCAGFEISLSRRSIHLGDNKIASALIPAPP